MRKEILSEKLKIYNKAIWTARQFYFSNLINPNTSNPRVLFNAIDHLINPDTDHGNHLIRSKSDEFADYFKEKTANIRTSICQLQNDVTAEETSSIQCEALLDSFSLVDAEMLRKVVTTLKSSTCNLDPVPTFF